MANLFAILDSDNEVENTVVGNDVDLITESQIATHENVDVSKVKRYSDDGTYLNRGIARPGDTWITSGSYFKEPQPYASWTWNETNREWDPPITEPVSQTAYTYWWEEDNSRWVGYVIADNNPSVTYSWDDSTSTWSLIT